MRESLTPSALEKLVKKAQKGEEKAFGKLFDHFFDKIHRYVRFRVDDREVDDLVGEIFLKVVEHLQRYKPRAKATFSSWIFRIAHNGVIDHYRKKKEILGLEDEEENNYFLELVEDAEKAPDKVAHRVLEHRKMYKFLKELPSLQREILELRYLEGFSTKEIAQIVGKKSGNVRVIQLRALRDIRQKWDE